MFFTREKKMEGLQAFQARINFNPAKAFWTGIERECFIVNGNGQIVPEASRIIDYATRLGWRENGDRRVVPGSRIGYELSACQIETRTEPSPLEGLPVELERSDNGLRSVLEELDFDAQYIEVAPDDMPLDVYPDPTGRYAALSQSMSRERLLAACQVAGTHVHIGMPDHATALKVYNRLTSRCGALCRAGDGSNGRRLMIYAKVAADRDPKPYDSWEHFHETAVTKKFVEDPRSCWTLIRISVQGTIEFRMFGSTPSLACIRRWARICHTLCVRAAEN